MADAELLEQLCLEAADVGQRQVVEMSLGACEDDDHLLLYR